MAKTNISPSAGSASAAPGKIAKAGGTASTSKKAEKPSAPRNTRAKAGKAGFYQPDMHSLRLETNIGRLIKQVYVSINRMIDLGVMPLGLTAMQWRPLVLIAHDNVDTPAELSRKSHVDTGAMTRTLDRLEAKGFLTRQRCAEDRRVVKLTLTDSGRKVVNDIFPAVADTFNAHLHGFSKNEIETLFDLLQRMIANGACKNEADGHGEP
jgi:DNA-binding MarR family transcriptional regulator